MTSSPHQDNNASDAAVAAAAAFKPFYKRYIFPIIGFGDDANNWFNGLLSNFSGPNGNGFVSPV